MLICATFISSFPLSFFGIVQPLSCNLVHLAYSILQDPNKRNLLSEKEIEFAQRIVNLQIEHLQSEVLNKVDGWHNEDLDISKLAKWGKHYPDDKYVCIR